MKQKFLNGKRRRVEREWEKVKIIYEEEQQQREEKKMWKQQTQKFFHTLNGR